MATGSLRPRGEPLARSAPSDTGATNHHPRPSSHDRRLPPISHRSPAPHPRSPQWRDDFSILDKAEANYRHHPAINELPRRKNRRRLQRSRARGCGSQIPCRHFSSRAQGLASWRYSQQVGRQNTVYVSRWLHFGPALLNKQAGVPLTPARWPCPLGQPAALTAAQSTIDTFTDHGENCDRMLRRQRC